MVLIIAVVVGLIAGYIIHLPDRWRDKLGNLSFIALAVLLLALGAQIGADPAAISNLGNLGLKSLLLTLFSIGGSVGGVWLVEKRLFKRYKAMGNMSSGEGEENPFRLAIIIGLILTAGIACGYQFLAPEHLPLLANLATYALALMLFFVGFDLARNKHVWSQLRKMGVMALFIPVGVMLGGVLGALIGGLIIGISVPVALATGAASGFYSYSGVVVAEIVGAEAGAIAFLANFFRELLSFFIIPILGVRLKGSIAAIAPGGATTMDTTLPVIVRSLGSDAAAIALINGSLVSLLVPVVLPLLLNL